MPEGMVSRLSDMRLDEVSLVDRGGNQHADIVISKRDTLAGLSKASPTPSQVHHDKPLDDEEDDEERRKQFANSDEDAPTVEDELSKADADDEILALLERLAQRRVAATEEEEAEPEEEPEAEGEEPGSIEEMLAQLMESEAEPSEEEEAPGEEPAEEDEEEAPPEGLEGEGEVESDKLPDAASEEEPKVMPGDLPEEVSEYVGELERTIEEMENRFKEEAHQQVNKQTDEDEVTKMGDEAKATKTKTNDDVTKGDAKGGLTEEEVSFLEDLAKRYEDGEVDQDEVISKALEQVRKSDERAERAVALAKAERDLRVTRESIERVEKNYPHLAVDPQEFGPVLKRAQDALGDEDFEALEKALGSVEALAKASDDDDVHPLFREVGKRGGAAPANSAVDAEADEMVKKGEAKSREEAIAKLYTQRPELYDEYLSENEAQAR